MIRQYKICEQTISNLDHDGSLKKERFHLIAMAVHRGSRWVRRSSSASFSPLLLLWLESSPIWLRFRGRGQTTMRKVSCQQVWDRRILARERQNAACLGQWEKENETQGRRGTTRLTWLAGQGHEFAQNNSTLKIQLVYFYYQFCSSSFKQEFITGAV